MDYYMIQFFDPIAVPPEGGRGRWFDYRAVTSAGGHHALMAQLNLARETYDPELVWRIMPTAPTAMDQLDPWPSARREGDGYRPLFHVPPFAEEVAA